MRDGWMGLAVSAGGVRDQETSELYLGHRLPREQHRVLCCQWSQNRPEHGKPETP